MNLLKGVNPNFFAGIVFLIGVLAGLGVYFSEGSDEELFRSIVYGAGGILIGVRVSPHSPKDGGDNLET